MTRRSIDRPTLLAFTPDPEAQALVASDPIAFLIGYVLDQQIRIQLAFHGPLELRRRLGHLDPARIAAMPIEDLEAVFAMKPPLHRYPNSMAKRVHDCMAFVIERYGGDADRIWSEAADLSDLRKRLGELPGFGPAKCIAVSAVLCRHFGLDFDGWEKDLPPYGALAYVDSIEDLEAYQHRKSEYKKAQKSARTKQR